MQSVAGCSYCSSLENERDAGRKKSNCLKKQEEKKKRKKEKKEIKGKGWVATHRSGWNGIEDCVWPVACGLWVLVAATLLDTAGLRLPAAAWPAWTVSDTVVVPKRHLGHILPRAFRSLSSLIT
jgi:hypothetical protein